MCRRFSSTQVIEKWRKWEVAFSVFEVFELERPWNGFFSILLIFAFQNRLLSETEAYVYIFRITGVGESELDSAPLKIYVYRQKLA